jgi:hypothetical protein
MSAQPAEGQGHKYDRAFLLSDSKRNQVVELWEVQQFGIDSFADPEYVCIYGMSPTEWYRRGIRLLARTTLEAVRDRLGDLIGQDVARVLHNAPPATTFTVIDPFAGSCNGLYWLVRHVRNSQGLGFEIEKTIFDMTTRNLHIASLERPIELIHGDYKSLLSRASLARGPVYRRLPCASLGGCVERNDRVGSGTDEATNYGDRRGFRARLQR